MSTRLQSLNVCILTLFVCFIGCSTGAHAHHVRLHRTLPRLQEAHVLRLHIDELPGMERRGTSPSSSPPARTRDQTIQAQFVLPRPFDSNLGNNFSSESCPAFFHDFLSDEIFQKCLPLSLLLQVSNVGRKTESYVNVMLLQTSSTFFEILSSPTHLTETLDVACAVDFPTCSNLLSYLAAQLQTSAHCGQDLEMGNPMVEQAYNGFIAYDSLYQTGCLRAQESHGNYCFANAMTDTSSPTSSYIYYLPLGMQLPASTHPTCDGCLHRTLDVFATYAVAGNRLLSGTYADATQVVGEACGNRFVDSSVQETSGANGFGLRSSDGIGGLLALYITLITFSFLLL